jgi:nitrite reductase/ring-hydroxylating ferredoxin subunit
MSWLTDRLAQLMRERSQTVEQMARQLGIERSRLTNIIGGSAIPNENLTRRLAKHFSEDPGEWLANAPQPEDAKPAPNLPLNFIKVATVSELPEGEMKIVFNDLVVVANVRGCFHAFGNVCPHTAGPIGEGFLDGNIVECPWHAAQWDIVTGGVRGPRCRRGCRNQPDARSARTGCDLRPRNRRFVISQGPRPNEDFGGPS